VCPIEYYAFTKFSKNYRERMYRSSQWRCLQIIRKLKLDKLPAAK